MTDVGPFTRVECPGCGDELRVKTELGGFRLVRRLAVGGMSVVYVARDQTLDREVAVKILSEECSADSKRERQFEREADLTAAVSHPNVVRVFTVGRAFDRFYIAMELVNGQSLEERMAVRGALSEDEAIPFALQVVDGLRAAKTAGLIHRDIKPGNILIDEGGTVKIVDFGLSLLTEGGAARAEEIWATPHYVAPEALEHREEDFRSDIYALGACLYHGLSGRSPVETKDLSTRRLKEAKQNIPPLRKVAPWLSVETLRVVEKAMAFDREDRFESYEEMRQALEAARVALGVKGARMPVHGTVRARRRMREASHRRMLLGALGLAVLIVAGVTLHVLTDLALPDLVSEAPPPAPLVVAPMDPKGLDPEAAIEIEAAYEGARRALAEDDFVVAEERFIGVWRHEAAPVPTAAWAGFEAAVVAYLDGRPGDARGHLSALGNYLAAQRAEDTALGRRLRLGIEVLTALEDIPESRIPGRLEDPFRATVFFAMCLKTWEQGDLDRAAGMFQRLVRSGPWPDGEWMDAYRQLAERYVEDFFRLQRYDHEVEDKSRRDLEKAVLRLEEIYASLTTRGRARFNVKVWQSEVVRRLRELTHREVAPQWKEKREEVAEIIGRSRFAEAAGTLKAAKVEGKLEKTQQRLLVRLCDAASAFLSELERVLGPGADGVEVQVEGGASYARILGTLDGGLLVDENGAAKMLRWGEVAPLSLLALHQQLLEHTEGSLDRKRRLFQAIAFAWLRGRRAEAERMARELEELSPEFKGLWNEVDEKLGESP